MENRSQKFLRLLIIINYQYQLIIDGNRSINIIDCYKNAISIDYLFSQTFQLPISSSTNKLKLHIKFLISLLLGIPHGRTRWTLASVQTYKERRRKRNNNSLNRVCTIIDEQFSNFATEV